jgi:hypothetical protein
LAAWERAVIEWNEDCETKSMAAWLLQRTANAPGAAEALALQCVHEAARTQDQDAVTRWSLVCDAIEELRSMIPAAAQRVQREGSPDLYEFTPIWGLRTNASIYGMARKLVELDPKTAKRKAINRIKDHAEVEDMTGAETWIKIARIIDDMT